MRAAVLIAALALAPLPALAQGGPRVMQDPSSHPDGDSMGWRSSGPAGACGADRLAYLVGLNWPQRLPVQPRALRVFAAGDPVTMDMNPERLNIELDPTRRRVVAVSCG